MDAIAAIMGRFSPLRITEPGPTAEQIETILGAAARAPDNGRLRPYRFLVIGGAARARFGRLMAASLLRRDPGATGEALEREGRKPLATPLVIVIGVSIAPDHRVSELDQIMAGAAAAQNVLLAAHALGYAAVWRTGPAAVDRELCRALGFADGDQLIGFLHIGTLEARPPVAEGDFAPLTRWLEAAEPTPA